jgi:uncharacterized cupredoxin-like copper-binding protein
VRRIAPILVVLALAGCGGKSGGNEPAASPVSGKTVRVGETEFKLTPAKIAIAKPGTVTFEAANDGKYDHALELEGNGVEEKTGTIAPGSSSKLTVDLSKAGTYELYCPIDGHRGMGMEATVVVGGGGSSGTTTESGGGGGIPGY